MAALPLKFDNTLGAAFIGLSISSVLYGTNVVQIFMYITSGRSKNDRAWLKWFMYILFLFDTGHQIFNVTALYRWMVTNFANPLGLIDVSVHGGRFFLSVEASFGVVMIAAVQLYFSFRLWVFGASFRRRWRYTITGITVALALFTLAANTVVVYHSFPQIAGPGIPDQIGILSDWKFALPAAIACDILITIAMVVGLDRSMTGQSGTDSALRWLITFTVNTGLVTTVLTIASLVTWLLWPQSLIFAALEFVVPKSYVNQAMAAINSRDLIQQKMNQEIPLTIASFSTRSQPYGVQVTTHFEAAKSERDSTLQLPSGQPQWESPAHPRQPQPAHNSSSYLMTYADHMENHEKIVYPHLA